MANPQTCRHNIITAVVDIETLEQWFACVSCNTRMTMMWIKGRKGKYVYDKAERVWVYMSKMKADFLAESKIAVVGTDKIVEPSEIVIKKPEYNDCDWFITIQNWYLKVWEFQFNIDSNQHEWVEIIDPATWTPRGRQITVLPFEF